MKNETERQGRMRKDESDAASRARSNGQGALRGGADTLVRFASARAHEAVDLLHAQAKARIDRVERAAGELGLDRAWPQLQPLARRGARFAQHHPLRIGLMVALLGCVWLIASAPERAAD